LYLGPFILIVGAVNGFLGFSFSGSNDDNIWYGVIVAVIFLGLAAMLFWVRWKKRRDGRKSREGAPYQGAYEQYSHQGMGRDAHGPNHSGFMMENLGGRNDDARPEHDDRRVEPRSVI
jgi:hypothetical protein